MKAKDALKRYDKNLKLKVGASQSYFYVGTVGDFLEHISEVSAKLEMQLKRRTQKKQLAYSKRLDNGPTVKAFCGMQERGGGEFTAEAYIDYVNRWFRTTGEMYAEYVRAKERERNFKTLDKREVRICRKADEAVDMDCVLMVLEGREGGAYWTTDDAAPGSVGLSNSEKEEDNG